MKRKNPAEHSKTKGAQSPPSEERKRRTEASVRMPIRVGVRHDQVVKGESKESNKADPEPLVAPLRAPPWNPRPR